MHPTQQSVLLLVFTRSIDWLYWYTIYQRNEVSFKFRYIVKHDFTWMWVSGYPWLIEQLTYPVRVFMYVFIFSWCNLLDIKTWYLYNFEPACDRINQRHAGKDKIIWYYSANCLLLHYQIWVYTYQVYIHQVTWF